MAYLVGLLEEAVRLGASDLHLSSGLKPIVRVNGELRGLGSERIFAEILTDKLLQQQLESIRPKQARRKLEEDFSFEIENLTRFRVNIFHQARGVSAVFRVISNKIPTLKELLMPSEIEKLCVLENGLVLITGPTGCGKSTTLAAMIQHINLSQAQHVITLEDPIEYVYTPEKALIQQREVHQHTESFQDALRASLREDPDVILVGELRDLETIRLALTAAETGHLVFATLHTSSAITSINRMIDVFPSGEKELVRTMLADSLKAVVSQILIKKKLGGRISAQEIMVCNPAIRNLIRENKIPQIISVIQTGRAFGMNTLEQSLQELKDKNLI